MPVNGAGVYVHRPNTARCVFASPVAILKSAVSDDCRNLTKVFPLAGKLNLVLGRLVEQDKPVQVGDFALQKPSELVLRCSVCILWPSKGFAPFDGHARPI